jgi:SAM-dependent methyltransferase
MTPQELRQQMMAWGQGAMALQIGFVGVSTGLFEALGERKGEGLDVAALAAAAGVDAGYTRRWADAAYAFGYLEAAGDTFTLAPLGEAMRPSAPGTLMPFAVQAVLGAHMAERAAGLARTGERPGERVLGERETILPWFGPMLEASFGTFFEREVVPGVPAFAEVDARGGTALDLGCGNGWYLRRLAARMPHLRGIGLDGFGENIRQATAAADREGLGDRLQFIEGDIYAHAPLAPVDLVAMNRALHHVWDQKTRVFGLIRDALRPGGLAVIWEPAWTDDRAALRDPPRRAMAFQNLNEHVQGNHFLRPEEIVAAFAAVDMPATVYTFANGAEAVVVARRPVSEG